MTIEEIKALSDKVKQSGMSDEEKLTIFKELNQLIEEMRADIAKAKIAKQI